MSRQHRTDRVREPQSGHPIWRCEVPEANLDLHKMCGALDAQVAIFLQQTDATEMPPLVAQVITSQREKLT